MTATMATINPLGYRGYVLDIGTYLYYCQSRYYDPAVGRFINADGLVSTGQGFVGNNMFAYCGNNPVNRVDPSGYNPIDVAIDFLVQWLIGNGESVTYDGDSDIAEKIISSGKMESIIDDTIRTYEELGYNFSVGDTSFTSEDDVDLYLTIGACYYKVNILSCKYSFEMALDGFTMIFSMQKTYTIKVTITDTYDFDLKSWEGYGNILNNIAYYLNSTGYVGRDYPWSVSYEQTITKSSILRIGKDMKDE